MLQKHVANRNAFYRALTQPLSAGTGTADLVNTEKTLVVKYAANNCMA